MPWEMVLLLKSEDMASFGGCGMPWFWAPTSNCVKPSEGTDCLKSHHRRVLSFVRLRKSAFHFPGISIKTANTISSATSLRQKQ